MSSRDGDENEGHHSRRAELREMIELLGNDVCHVACSAALQDVMTRNDICGSQACGQVEFRVIHSDDLSFFRAACFGRELIASIDDTEVHMTAIDESGEGYNLGSFSLSSPSLGDDLEEVFDTFTRAAAKESGFLSGHRGDSAAVSLSAPAKGFTRSQMSEVQQLVLEVIAEVLA